MDALCSIAYGRGGIFRTSSDDVETEGLRMADDKKKRGGSDRGLIALSEPYEVRYWSKKFKVTPAKLK